MAVVGGERGERREERERDEGRRRGRGLPWQRYKAEFLNNII